MPTVDSLKIGRSRAVLFVGPAHVEWAEFGSAGVSVFGRGALLGENPGDVAQAALGLVRSLGRKPKECVLVLADELLRERVVPMATMSDRERRAALRRKAANLSESKEHATVLGAVRLGQAASTERGREGELEKWLLVTRERSYVVGLQLQLRRHGLRVRRILPARLVALGHGDLLTKRTADGARVVVGIEPGAAILSLVHGDHLVHQTVLTGAFGPGSSLGTTLVQELRGLDLFWRKLSRGETVAEVLVVGIEPADAASLQPAICAALPGTRAVLRPDPAASSPDAGRAEVLAAALHPGPFALDLAVPLPPRPRSVVLLTVALVVMAAVAGVLGLGRVEEEHRTWRAAAESLAEEAQDLPEVLRERARREHDIQRLHGRRERLAALDDLGLPLEELLLDVAEAFEGRATLGTLALTSGPQGLQVDATGETSADPLGGYVALEELRRALEASPRFQAVELTPPASLPGGPGGAATHLGFGLRALGEERP